SSPFTRRYALCERTSGNASAFSTNTDVSPVDISPVSVVSARNGPSAATTSVRRRARGRAYLPSFRRWPIDQLVTGPVGPAYQLVVRSQSSQHSTLKASTLSA